MLVVFYWIAEHEFGVETRNSNQNVKKLVLGDVHNNFLLGVFLHFVTLWWKIAGKKWFAAVDHFEFDFLNSLLLATAPKFFYSCEQQTVIFSKSFFKYLFSKYLKIFLWEKDAFNCVGIRAQVFRLPVDCSNHWAAQTPDISFSTGRPPYIA